MTRGWSAPLAVLCLLVTGCGSFLAGASQGTPGTASYTRLAPPKAAPGQPVADTCPVAQLPSSFPASPASNQNLVLGKLRGSNLTVVRDVTDINHPSTVANAIVPAWSGWGWVNPSFVSASTISYSYDRQPGLVRMPLSGVGSSFFEVGCRTKVLLTYRWSPDGQSLTYVLSDDDRAGTFHWHLATGAGDREIGTAPLWCRDTEMTTPRCSQRFEDGGMQVGFSSDGKLVWLVERLHNSTDLQVRSLDGSLVGTEIRGDSTYLNPVSMGLWSGGELFYRDSQGVSRWADGVSKRFLPGVGWLYPKASPAGGQIVYVVRGSDGLGRINVVDTSNGRARQLTNQPRTRPVFLTPRYVWYMGERLCEPQQPCIASLASTFTGTTYIYDLQTGTESESVIADVADVWPHGA